MVSRLESYLHFLRTDPLGFLVYALYFTVTVLLSLILHEVAHGYVALRCGDPTAKMMGRLSLNPKNHLDPVGTVCMFLLGFGWAKPVPVNPRYFRNGRRDDFLVSIAGICVNLTLFILCAALSVTINQVMWQEGFLDAFKQAFGSLQGLVNVYDSTSAGNYAAAIYAGGSFDYLGEMARYPWLLYVQRFLLLMGQINLSLAVFNLLPIPPLDGYHLVNDTLLKGKWNLSYQAFQLTRMILLVACLSGALGKVLSTVNTFLYTSVVNVFLLLVGGL